MPFSATYSPPTIQVPVASMAFSVAAMASPSAVTVRPSSSPLMLVTLTVLLAVRLLAAIVSSDVTTISVAETSMAVIFAPSARASTVAVLLASIVLFTMLPVVAVIVASLSAATERPLMASAVAVTSRPQMLLLTMSPSVAVTVAASPASTVRPLKYVAVASTLPSALIVTSVMNLAVSIVALLSAEMIVETISSLFARMTSWPASNLESMMAVVMALTSILPVAVMM